MSDFLKVVEEVVPVVVVEDLAEAAGVLLAAAPEEVAEDHVVAEVEDVAVAGAAQRCSSRSIAMRASSSRKAKRRRL